MDYTANEVDVKGLVVKGFPTIYFFKGDDKSNPIKYEEGRELKDFVKFLVIFILYSYKCMYVCTDPCLLLNGQ